MGIWCYWMAVFIGGYVCLLFCLLGVCLVAYLDSDLVLFNACL